MGSFIGGNRPILEQCICEYRGNASQDGTNHGNYSDDFDQSVAHDVRSDLARFRDRDTPTKWRNVLKFFKLDAGWRR